MTIQDWQPRLAAIAAEANDGDGAHDMAHLHRVWGNARQLLAAHADADPLVVLAACYLHDLVNLPKNHPDRASASKQSAEYATKRLHILGFPAELLDRVAHAIEAHSFSARIAPRTIEAMIVQDADRLDALGAVGLARLFYIAGRMGSALAHPTDPLAHARELDDRAYALDHIMVKLATLPAMMNTEEARRIGEERLAQLLQFRVTFAAEWLVTNGASPRW